MNPQDLLGPLPPERPIPADRRERLKEQLMTAIEQDTKTTRRRRPRHRRTVAAASVLAVASIGTAWAMTTQAPEESTRIMCPDNLIIAAVSGDPIADCDGELRRRGIEPPELAAYTNERGGVVVVAADTDVPSDWQLLEADFRQDTAIIELEASLADVTTGLAALCYTNDEAIPIIDRELARLGLEWTIEVRDNADGVDSCAYVFLEPEKDQVTIAAVEGLIGTGDEPWIALGTRLNETLKTECLTLGQAAQTADSIAVEVGMDPDTQILVTTTVDAEASCTRATVTVGGAVFVDLRGPDDN